MTLSIGSNLKESFNFAKDGLVGHWVRWLALIIISIIPIVNFIAPGYAVRIYRGVSYAPDLDDWFGLFIDGLQVIVIAFVYMIIPLFLIVVGIAIIIYGMVGDDISSMVGGIALAVIGAILAFALGFLFIMGCVRFAKTDSMREAFNFGVITERIREIGWGSYILAYFVFSVLTGFINGILSVLTHLSALTTLTDIFVESTALTVIPLVGWLLTVIITPFLLIWQAKYFENIYSLA